MSSGSGKIASDISIKDTPENRVLLSKICEGAVKNVSCGYTINQDERQSFMLNVAAPKIIGVAE